MDLTYYTKGIWGKHAIQSPSAPKAAPPSAVPTGVPTGVPIGVSRPTRSATSCMYRSAWSSILNHAAGYSWPSSGGGGEKEGGAEPSEASEEERERGE